VDQNLLNNPGHVGTPPNAARRAWISSDVSGRQ